MTGPDPAAHAELVRSLAPHLRTPVDELHVAATLESQGVNDTLARQVYGHDDVFALARSVLAALPAPPAERRPPARPWTTRRRLRVLSHGPLYALPILVYPAVFLTLGTPIAIRGLIMATAIGWVWGMAMGIAAHRAAGEDNPGGAAQLLRLFVLSGLALALTGGGVLVVLGDHPGVLALCVAQVGHQLGTGVLIFSAAESRVLLVMAPAALAGVAHLVTGYAGWLVVPVLAASAVSLLALLGLAARLTSAGGLLRPYPPGTLGRFAALVRPGMAYAAISAALLLFTNSRYVNAPWDLAVAVTPLVLGMGAVEWRTHRFDEQAADLVRSAPTAAAFEREVWRLALRELTRVLLVLGGIGLALLTTLATLGLLTDMGAMLVNAHIVLGATYFAGFVLANRDQFRRLLAAVAAVTGADVLVTVFLAEQFAPYREVPIFLASSVVLLLLLLAALRTTIGRVHQYQ